MSPSRSTRQQLVKVPQVPGLYRHSLNWGYYGIKKVGGKRKEHSLRTTDRKLAERRLRCSVPAIKTVWKLVCHSIANLHSYLPFA